MQVNFSSQTLVEIFRDLYHGERSGMLQLVRGDSEKRIYFDRGMILFAESDVEEEDLGRRLLAEGKLSAGALAEARRNIGGPKDLAQALVNRGLIGKDALSHTVRYLLERVVVTVFRWEGGTARFNDGWLLQEILESDVLLTFELILKGIDGMVGFAPVREAMRGLRNRLQLAPRCPVPLERLALTPAHGYILSRVDGSVGVEELLTLLPPGEEDRACRFVFGLLAMGVLRYDPPLNEGPLRVAALLRDHADQVALERMQEEEISQVYEKIRSSNPHGVLGVSPAASREEIERAYQNAKERFSRDRIAPRVWEKMRSELAVIESRLVEAYLTLNQARRPESAAQAGAGGAAGAGAPQAVEDLLVRVEMDKTVAKIALEESTKTAESYYQKARRFMRDGDFHNAIQYGKLAISYNEHDARFYALVGECQARNPDGRWQRMAEQNFLRAVELDPWNADYRIMLGRFYKVRGLKLRARRQFEEALQLVPSLEAAVAELKQLG